MAEEATITTEVAAPEIQSEETRRGLQERLTYLISLASAKEAVKEYDAAADLYSQSSEVQAQLNGDMAIENADVLYAYGRCLYQVGVQKSDVLGSKLAAPDATESSTRPQVLEKEVGDVNTVGSESKNKTQSHSTDQECSTAQPYFQFKGDEAFDESSSSASEDDHTNGTAQDEDDDFANAFEILDLARVLYLRKSAKLAENTSSDAADIRRVKERLADTYDIQAEISLEGERFSDAATDLRESLHLKQDLFPLEDPAIAECHYKLSLALEFSSVHGENSEGSHDGTDGSGKLDHALRKDAAKHMETAIESCKMRIAREQQRFATSETDNDGESAKIKRGVEEVKDIVSDMEQRVRL